MTEDHSAIHAVYCNATSFDLVLTMSRHYAWSAFKAAGWTAKDLVLVIDHLKAKIKRGHKWSSCLRFYPLICRLDEFEEELQEARALARIPKVDKVKESVLKATGRTTQPQPDNVKTPESILRGEEGLKALLKLRDSLND